MKSSYSFLALTDHRTHSEQNSIYGLLSELSSHHRCAQIRVASRGFPENAPFFNNMKSSEIWASEVNSNFNFDKDGNSYKNNLKKVLITDFDVILLRLPRPVDDAFLLWLKEIGKDKLFINDPNGIIETSNKAFLLNFPDLCPSMRLVHNVNEIMELAQKGPIVLKPLKEYGGKGLIRIMNNTVHDGKSSINLETYFKTHSEVYNNQSYLAMKYLKNVHKGDKRIVVVNGEIMAASLRLPADGSWLCNIAQGGDSSFATVDNDEIRIVEKVNSHLKSRGILIYGIDTLVDDEGKRVLSEVNTLSVGGLIQSQIQSGKPVINHTINRIIEHLDENDDQ